jgi:3-oxoadipate enol-lactonase
MPYLKRSGEPDLWYEVDDFTDPWRNAPCVVLQHGNGRSSRFWYQWVPYLSRFYKVVRPDVRGLGRSSADFDGERDLTLERCADDLVAILDVLGADSVHFCGESMGGMMGVVLAALHPARVRTLTLVSTPAYLREPGAKSSAVLRTASLQAVTEAGVKGWATSESRSLRFPDDADPGLIEWYASELARNRPEAADAMARFAEKADTRAYLKQVACPVLGLYPSAGPITSGDQEKLLAESLRNLRLIHLPAKYHKVQLMFPATCANHLLQFMAQHDGIACHEK